MLFCGSAGLYDIVLWVGPQTKLRLSPRSVSDSRCLISVCGRAHRASVCGFLVFWLQIAIEPFALFHHSVFDYMCFTVMFHS